MIEPYFKFFEGNSFNIPHALELTPAMEFRVHSCLFMNRNYPHIILVGFMDDTIVEWDIPLIALKPSSISHPIETVFYAEVYVLSIIRCRLYNAGRNFGLDFSDSFRLIEDE